MNLFEPPCAGQLGLRQCSLDPAGPMGRLDLLAALDLIRQPRGPVDQVALDGVAGLHVADPLLNLLFQLLRFCLG